MAAKTNRQDIINNFSRYLWRQPNETEIKKYKQLSPTVLEGDLKKQYKTITGKDYWKIAPVVNNPSTPVAIPNPSVIKDYNVTGRSADWKTLMGTPKTPVATTTTTTSGWGYDWTDPATGKPSGTVGVGNPTPIKTGWTTGDTWASWWKTEAELASEAEAKLEKDNLDAANKYIKGTAYDEATKALLRQISAQQYKSGDKIYQTGEIDKIISDATLASTQANSQYYATDTANSIQDLQNKYSDIRAQSDLNATNEKSTYAQTLQKAQQSLRASGRTFSSASRDKLWASSALGSRDVNWMEWSTPEARRTAVTEAYNKDAQNARDLWITAERYLGSSDLAWLNFGTIANPYATGNTYNPNSNTSLYTPAGWIVDGTQDLAHKLAIEKDRNERIKAMYL